MFKNLLKNYNGPIAKNTMQASSDSVVYKLLKPSPPGQSWGPR